MLGFNWLYNKTASSVTRSQWSLSVSSQRCFSACQPDGVLHRRTCRRRHDHWLPTPCNRRPRRRAAETLHDRRLNWRPCPVTRSRCDHHTGSKRAERMCSVMRRQSRGWLQQRELVCCRWRSRWWCLMIVCSSWETVARSARCLQCPTTATDHSKRTSVH